jgi:hypothetical protein
MSISDFIMGIEDYEDVQRWKKIAKCFRPGDAAALSLFFMNEICPDQEEGRNCDLCGREAKDLCDLISRVQAAAEMAEGKIGPSAAKTIDQTRISAENPQKPGPNHQKPAIWQITEERIEALEYMCEWHFCTDKLQFCEKYPEHILQAMLTEAGQ